MNLYNNFSKYPVILMCCILFLVLSCDSPIGTIRVEINEQNQFFVNSKEIPATDLKQVLSEEKLKLSQQGYGPGKISVETKVNANATVKSLGHLIVTLRELNIKKIEVQ